MSFELALFYGFSAVLVAAATAVITVRNPVHAALFLVLAFFTSAAIWMLLEVEFLAIALVLVYVGAVMVLFLFVVMMIDVNVARVREGFARYLPVGVVVAVVMAAEMFLVVGARNFGFERFGPLERYPADYSNTSALAETLYTEFVFPFEVAAVILLVAIIAAIALTHRKRPETKYQDPSRQVQVTKADRLRVVDMKSEPRKPQEWSEP